jgi:hypothetical protein
MVTTTKLLIGAGMLCALTGMRSVPPPAAAGGPPSLPAFSNPLSITNSYHPFVVGGIKTFEGVAGGAKAFVQDDYLATTRTFQLGGASVPCHILRESEYEGGEVTEISHNYFAQGDDGAVYYFGEVVDEYENGVVVGHGGSWVVGPAAATDPPGTAVATEPAVFMPADPQLGDVWKPEDLFPFVDETAEAVQVGIGMNVPAGHFLDCIKVRETSALTTGFESKWYAPGVGVVKVTTGGEHLKLVSTTFGL